MTVDLSKLSFYSALNYMKRHPAPLIGTALVTLPSSGNSVTHTVDHNLNAVPDVHVSSDVDSDGVIWSNQKVHLLTDSALSGITPSQVQQVVLNYWVNTTQLGIVLYNQTTTAAGQQRRIYWVIYRDYA